MWCSHSECTGMSSHQHQLVVPLVVGERRQIELRHGEQLGVGARHPAAACGQVDSRVESAARAPASRSPRPRLGRGRVDLRPRLRNAGPPTRQISGGRPRRSSSGGARPARSATTAGGEPRQRERADQQAEVAQRHVVVVAQRQQVDDDAGQPGGDEVGRRTAGRRRPRGRRRSR